MDANELHALNSEIGAKHLAKAGFEYQNQNWHYIENDIHLSFILGNKKYSNVDQVKWLTVTLVHDWVVIGDNKVSPKKFENRDGGCAVQVSPMILPQLVKSKYDPKIWHYVNLAEHGEDSRCYEPLYYNADRKAKKNLKKGIKNVAKFAVSWAHYMKPERILEQMKQYGNQWWNESKWIETYENDKP